jgi:hypothetical protein
MKTWFTFNTALPNQLTKELNHRMFCLATLLSLTIVRLLPELQMEVEEVE